MYPSELFNTKNLVDKIETRGRGGGCLCLSLVCVCADGGWATNERTNVQEERLGERPRIAGQQQAYSYQVVTPPPRSPLTPNYRHRHC